MPISKKYLERTDFTQQKVELALGYVKTSVCIDDDVYTLDEFAVGVVAHAKAEIALQLEVPEADIKHISTRIITKVRDMTKEAE
ncbi:hypothetical protein [Ruminococcus sp. Marseille-P6503]|uniref:hypothetical protein n=1 Tax=Ruminococcus sp. Marseille-P6503 TaxID=2364796 RepID=UPI000F53E7FE|nr:hypothetical protein [Ruminococcus sp. Marseille-P6503]